MAAMPAKKKKILRGRDVKTGFFPKPVIGLQKPVFSR